MYTALVHGRPVSIPENMRDAAIELARLNKMDLEIYKLLNLRDEHERGLRILRERLSILEILHREADGQFVLFKFRRPVLYVPSDLDLLAPLDAVPLIVSILREVGFRIVVQERYCVTLVKGDHIVDVYVHPCIGGSVVYLRGDVLLRHVDKVSILGVETLCLTPSAEALVAASHAVYKEGIVTLNDVVTIVKWINDDTLKLAHELHCLDAVKYVLDIARRVEHGLEELPHKIPTPTHARIIFRKVLRDPTFRETLLYFIEKLRDRRLGQSILSHITRITY